MSAIGVFLFSSVLWGLTWWPLKFFATQGLSGSQLAMLSYGFAGVRGLPWLLRQHAHWRAQTGHSGVIAIAELAVALPTATLLGGESMTPLERLGATLIGSSAVLAATDGQTPRRRLDAHYQP